jgi:beta-lactamase regulating signal transducer with metallopeptidase domain
MVTLLDTIGPAVWRASWQAAAVALFVALILRCFGERISPRWRYLFWCVVVVRLVVVDTPASPWSVFNLVAWNQEAKVASDPHGSESIFPQTTRPSGMEAEPPLIVKSLPESPARQPSAISVSTEIVPSVGAAVTRPIGGGFHVDLVVRILSSLWLVGCLMFGLRLLATALVLRRHLSVCRPVTDVAVLQLLEAIRSQIGLKRTPALVVTPEPISPCFAGTWNPRIILPESIITAPLTASLRHVLAHELAHGVRGDLWTNWLLLAARILHWFNPIAWYAVGQMQAEREAACDELALAALGQTERSAYARTIVDLATNLIPARIAPGMIGFFSTGRRLTARIERLARVPAARALRTSVAASLVLAMALLGLTDAMPNDGAIQPTAGAAPIVGKAEVRPARESEPKSGGYRIRGRCVDHIDNAALAGVEVRLFKIRGQTLPIVESAHTVTDINGRFEFTGLEPPRPYDRLDRLFYFVAALGGNRPVSGYGVGYDARPMPNGIEMRLSRASSKLSGKVISAQGQPVAGATVMASWFYDGRPIPGILSATTDQAGRFVIEKVLNEKSWGVNCDVVHPQYPETTFQVNGAAADVSVSLPSGCRVSGIVSDSMSGRPAMGALLTAERLDPSAYREFIARTDAAGRFEMIVPEGRYNFTVAANDRVSVAVTDRECLAGQKVELPPFKLIAGGFISGQVVNMASGQSVFDSESGEPVMLGLYGPAQPAPGANYPYLVNTRGDRMGWDTQKQPPVMVIEGQTTAYNMLVTPEVPPEEKLKAARALVVSLPRQPAERTAQILLEFRKLSSTVDETERWCALMRELVTVGRAAVPQICDELDQTTADGTLRRLAFALRAIGDPRSVPALIRAIPKTLKAPSSDFGLIVNDNELAAFMQRHSLGNTRGIYFDLGRPVREVFDTLHKLSGQNFDDAELFGIFLSEDTRRHVLQRRLYERQALRWQTWWETHWRELTDDPAYQKVNLAVVDEALPAASKSLGRKTRLGDGIEGEVLSPASQRGQYAVHFYDLDTGYQPKWPAHIPQDEAQIDQKQLANWAVENGVDLMCVTLRAPDGTQTYVLRAFNMQAWEINQRDLRNIDRLTGTLPQGRAVGELLMHYDPESRQFVPDANAAFTFVTREGSMGLIETTDRVTRTADLTGIAVSPPRGVGFQKGVRFNVKLILP